MEWEDITLSQSEDKYWMFSLSMVHRKNNRTRGWEDTKGGQTFGPRLKKQKNQGSREMKGRRKEEEKVWG